MWNMFINNNVCTVVQKVVEEPLLLLSVLQWTSVMYDSVSSVA